MFNANTSGEAARAASDKLRRCVRAAGLCMLGLSLAACSSDSNEQMDAATDATTDGSVALDAGPDGVSDAAADQVVGDTGAEAAIEDALVDNATEASVEDAEQDASVADAAQDASVEDADLDTSVEDAQQDVSTEDAPAQDVVDVDVAAPDVSIVDAADDVPDDVQLDVESDVQLSDAAEDAFAEASVEAGEDAGPSCNGLPALQLTKVFEGLGGVLLVTHAPGDATRLFVVQQSGMVRLAKAGVLQTAPFLDITALISTGGERGLLGLAFHPDYQANGRFWINYTDSSGSTVVAEYHRSAGNDDVADDTFAKTLFTVPQPSSNHNGGMLAFGADGYLYVGMGDGGGAGDPTGNGQNLTTKLGKLLRVDVDNYPTPPPGNLSGPGVDPQIWAYGLRNPWRFSFDSQTGDLYLADVGQGAFEEVNVALAGVGGQNYGWNVMEGTACYPPGSTCDTTGMTLPVVEYDHGSGCSITGGYVYRGQAIPCMQGRYLYADFCSARVWSFVFDGAAPQDQQELTADLQSTSLISGLTSFGEDGAGELYLCSGSSGEVFRIDAE